MFPTGSFMHHNPPSVSISHVQRTSLQCSLVACTITHLTPFPPHTWPISMSIYIIPLISTLKMEAAWSSEMLVSQPYYMVQQPRKQWIIS
jgi:hypothetical protein